jgi:methyl-accepting chemotaxis protein
VASEVRQLAEPSQAAARELGALTTASVTVAERAGSSLAALVPVIRKTAELVQEVAAASREPSASVALVNRAVRQVDEVTQHNAAAAEKLASTADALAGQAESLRQMMAFFRVSHEQSAQAPMPRQLAAPGEPVPVRQPAQERWWHAARWIAAATSLRAAALSRPPQAMTAICRSPGRRVP